MVGYDTVILAFFDGFHHLGELWTVVWMSCRHLLLDDVFLVYFDAQPFCTVQTNRFLVFDRASLFPLILGGFTEIHHILEFLAVNFNIAEDFVQFLFETFLVLDIVLQFFVLLAQVVIKIILVSLLIRGEFFHYIFYVVLVRISSFHPLVS
ncbi:hypothetical protein IJG92_00405 [Candidatus Saccharibacteria bacterium]|nr:hypothetical protein [Candidatus Saccharibacteria bacterium]